jgi:hypothetical protein
MSVLTYVGFFKALPTMKLDDVATTPEARETTKTGLFRSASSPRPAVAFLDPGEIEVQKDYQPAALERGGCSSDRVPGPRLNDDKLQV